MSFSDEDLKRLKERPWCAHEKHAPRDCGVLASILESDLPALLARLEAAELVILYSTDNHLQYDYQKEMLPSALSQWRKAAGK